MVNKKNLDELDDTNLLFDDDEIEFDVDLDGDWDED